MPIRSVDLSAILGVFLSVGAVPGTSRGRFLALHFAATEPRVRAVATFAPVTKLLALAEFDGLKDGAATAAEIPQATNRVVSGVRIRMRTTDRVVGEEQPNDSRLHGRLWGSGALLLSAKEGRIATVVFRWHGSPGRCQWETTSHPVDDELSFPVGRMDQYVSRIGFGCFNRPICNKERSTQILANGEVILMKNSSRLNGAGPLVPIWFLVVLISACATLPWVLRRFSVRMLLIATTLVAITLGLIVLLR